MNRFVKIIMLLAVVVALAGTYSYVAAQDELTRNGSTGPRTVVDVRPPVAATNHVLKATYINTCLPSNCTSEISLPGGTFVSLDSPTTITCAAPLGKTCTITDTAFIATENSAGVNNNAGSLSLVVDGTAAETFFSGSTGFPGGPDFDGLYAKIMVVTGVSKGTHTVQTQARSISGGGAFAWAAKYEVYVP